MRHKIKSPIGKSIFAKQASTLTNNEFMKGIYKILEDYHKPSPIIVHPNTYKQLHAHFYIDGDKTYQYVPIK